MKRFFLILFTLLVFNIHVALAQKVCFKCHLKDKIIPGPYVHDPIKKHDCLKCHLPHVSRHKFLLRESVNNICFTCHKDLEKKFRQAVYIHRPVREKACLRCHVPHASKYKALLRKDTKTTCLSCHKELAKKEKYLHKPFAKGECLVCHDPHFGFDTRFLNNKKPDSICLKCHKKNDKFLKAHFDRKDIKNCLSCHSPHQSNNRNLLRPFKHKPFAKGNCKVCHKSPYKGINKCLQCHKQEMKTFYNFHNHLLGGYDKNACILCHNPHVGETKELLVDSPARLCTSCHPTAYKQKLESLYIHPKRNNCLECHKAHGSNHPAMLNGDGNQVCVRCHKTQGKFTHPVGNKVLDPRNGQPVTCITCHEPMGTNFKYELKLSGEAALCLECHKNY